MMEYLLIIIIVLKRVSPFDCFFVRSLILCMFGCSGVSLFCLLFGCLSDCLHVCMYLYIYTYMSMSAVK